VIDAETRMVVIKSFASSFEIRMENMGAMGGRRKAVKGAGLCCGKGREGVPTEGGKRALVKEGEAIKKVENLLGIHAE
jgi:hypothetical protein